MPFEALAGEKAITDYVARAKLLENFLIVISLISCVLIIVAFIYFAFRYRRRSDKEEGHAKKHHSLSLEIIWSLIPLVIFLVVFVWGWILYKDFRQAPKNSLEIHVYGQKWHWNFVYKNGKKTTNEFYVPVDQPVKLIMTSRDVLHSFYLPSFRIKQDVLPGRYTSLWFHAKKKGHFQVFCAELCGSGHSSMGAKLKVLSLEEWEKWLKTDDSLKKLSLTQIGKKIFQGQCTACHKTTTENLIGPGLGGLYNKMRKLEDGQSLQADENYIRESILNPGAKIVQGYPNQMTPFVGLLSEEELSGLIAYIKSLK